MRQTNEAPQRASPGSRRLLLWLIAGGLILIVAVVVWSLAAKKNTAGIAPDRAARERYIREANRLYLEHRTNEALAALEEAKKSDPASTAPYLIRAKLLEQSAHFRQAREEMLTAYKIAPNDSEVTLALLRYTQGFFPPAEAESLARKVIAQVPNSGEAYYLLGLAIVNAADSQRYPEALKAFQEANRLAPSQAVTLIEMGKLYSLMGDNARAVTMLLTAARLLDQKGRQMSLREMEDWLKQRRAAAFWLAQVYHRVGHAVESRAATAEAAKWSAQAGELRTLRDRAAASPPDLKARARLEEILQRQNE